MAPRNVAGSPHPHPHRCFSSERNWGSWKTGDPMRVTRWIIWGLLFSVTGQQMQSHDKNPPPPNQDMACSCEIKTSKMVDKCGVQHWRKGSVFGYSMQAGIAFWSSAHANLVLGWIKEGIMSASHWAVFTLTTAPFKTSPTPLFSGSRIYLGNTWTE